MQKLELENHIEVALFIITSKKGDTMGNNILWVVSNKQ